MRTRVSIPEQVKRGETIEIRAVAQHPMESGFRRDSVGKKIPRDILTLLICRFNGNEIFRAELFPGIAANPYLSFYASVTQSGTFELTWVDQAGQETVVRKSIMVV